MGVKQVIVMRTDLNMRKGKQISQGAHSSISFLTEKIKVFSPGYKELNFDQEEIEWLKDGKFKKICVGIESEEKLLMIYEEAKAKGLRVHLITDLGLTEFHGVKTNTCICIGPNEESKIDEVTGNLKLL